MPEVGKSTRRNSSLDVMIHPRNWSLAEELDQSMVRLMGYICNAIATLLSDSILAERSLCTSASRCSAPLTGASLSALPQEWSLFLVPGRCSSVCWWMEQPHRSNSTQKRAVELTDTQSRRQFTLAARLSQPS